MKIFFKDFAKRYVKTGHQRTVTDKILPLHKVTHFMRWDETVSNSVI